MVIRVISRKSSLFFLTVAFLLVNAAIGRAQSVCVGDCSATGSVTVDGIIKLVNIALGTAAVSACAKGIPPDEFSVDVATIVRAVGNALNGCPVEPTATPSPEPSTTPTVEPSATPSEVPTATPMETIAPPSTATPTSTATPVPVTDFCSLPGAVRFEGPGVSTVPGGKSDAPPLSFLTLPIGFCAHFYAHVENARQLRFAPGGELFVASPSTFTTGGGMGGRAAITVVPDDDADGYGDDVKIFLNNIPANQGMLFTDGFFFYQNDTKIMRLPYTAGMRSSSDRGTQVANITYYRSSLHWPKPMDIADDGTIYVGNGGDDGEPCRPNDRAFHGGVLRLDGQGGAIQVAKGFRNPISVRCLRGRNMCFAVELAKDFSHAAGGREKLVPIRDGDDWGFPCCATKDKSYVTGAADCSGVAEDPGRFFIGDTPFDVDFVQGTWPAPWGHRAYVPLHGAYGSWAGARVVSIELDQMTGDVLPGSDLAGENEGSFVDFATGWDDGSRSHGRPANVVFSPDGRLFLGNDVDGTIFWIAPIPQ